MEYIEIKESENNSNERYLRAKERVAEVKKFYSSVMSYVGFISFLAVINYFTNEWRYMWFLWAAFGWGIGIVSQGIKVFGTELFLGKGWEDRKIKEFMNEEGSKSSWN